MFSRIKKVKIFFLLLFVFGLSTGCGDSPVHLSNSIEQDIVLVNIEEGDRSFIGNLILKLNSFKPAAIGLNAVFKGEKDRKQDSTLIDALARAQNVVIPYGYLGDGRFDNSHYTISSKAADRGLLYWEESGGEIKNMTPLKKIDDSIHESFALKILRHWQPGFKLNVDPNETIPIKYTNTLNKILHINGSDVLDSKVEDFVLQNKVLIVGYIGPHNEDRRYTPMRWAEKGFENEDPDTYGSVIIVNQIKTLLHYKK